jgi:undecaprenyl-diphosphatase
MRGAEDAGQLALDGLAAEEPPPSRYRNPGDVIGLIAAAGVLAVAVIAVVVAGQPSFGLASALAAAAVTGCVAALPWLWPGWRLAAWTVLLAGGAACLLSGAAGPAELAAGAAAGLLAGFGVRVAAGVPDRRLGPDGIAAALSLAGLPTGPVRPAGVPAKGSRPFTAVAADGRHLFIKVLGPDQRQADLLYRAYRAVWLKGVGDRRPAASLRQAVEHQALVALLAERAGVDVPRVHAVVAAPGGTALLVMDLVPGSSLDLLPAGQITDDLLRRLWTAVARLHAAHLAHRSLRAVNVVVEESGRPWLADFSFAELAASRRQMDLDVAELLASLAILVGPERAVASAATVIGTADLAAAVPLLQPLALSAATRRDLAARKGLLTETRSAAAARSGRTDEELASIQRVRPRTLITVAAAAAAFYYLLYELTKSGDSWRAVLSANWAWLPVVLAASALTYVASAIALAGSVTIRLRFWPTLVAQAASSFINRISLANVGGMALNARFLQKSGVEPAAGVSAVGVNALAGAMVHLALIAIFFTAASRRLTGAFKLPSPSKVLLGLGVAAALVGVILATRRGRRFAVSKIVPGLRSSLANLREVGRRPGKLVLLFGGSALVTLAYIGGLVAAVAAFGGPVSIAGIGAVYLASAAVAAVSPTPGGVGTFEAVLTAALTGIGIDASVAAPAVITYRLATYWLPVLPGWAALQFLQCRDLI